jgi:GAF domain-containing protein
MSCDASAVLSSLQARALETSDRDELARELVVKVKEAMQQASWVGIYWREDDALVLGPYVGPETEHVRIPMGKGICGTALEEASDQVVDDVRSVDNYLACSAEVRSELVVLIRSMGEVIGVLDLDANDEAAFREVDRCILRAIADSFGGLIAATGHKDEVEDAPDA